MLIIRNPQHTDSGGRFPAEYVVLVRGDKVAGGARSEEGGSGMFISWVRSRLLLFEQLGKCAVGTLRAFSDSSGRR